MEVVKSSDLHTHTHKHSHFVSADVQTGRVGDGTLQKVGEHSTHWENAQGVPYQSDQCIRLCTTIQAPYHKFSVITLTTMNIILKPYEHI